MEREREGGSGRIQSQVRQWRIYTMERYYMAERGLSIGLMDMGRKKTPLHHIAIILTDYW